MDRIKTFDQKGKQIVYYDLSGIKSNNELSDVIKSAKEIINGHTALTVYTITNISRISFDTKTKEIAAEWMAFNKPFVKYAAFIGVSGVRKIMMNAVFTLSNRENVKLFHEMEQALEWFDSI